MYLYNIDKINSGLLFYSKIASHQCGFKGYYSTQCKFDITYYDIKDELIYAMHRGYYDLIYFIINTYRHIYNFLPKLILKLIENGSPSIACSCPRPENESPGIACSYHGSSASHDLSDIDRRSSQRPQHENKLAIIEKILKDIFKDQLCDLDKIDLPDDRFQILFYEHSFDASKVTFSKSIMPAHLT